MPSIIICDNTQNIIPFIRKILGGNEKLLSIVFLFSLTLFSFAIMSVEKEVEKIMSEKEKEVLQL